MDHHEEGLWLSASNLPPWACSSVPTCDMALPPQDTPLALERKQSLHCKAAMLLFEDQGLLPTDILKN